MSSYDENLEENSFLKAFKEKQKVLFESSLNRSWIIAIPRQGSFEKPKYNDMDYLNHVLVPITEESVSNEKHFKTLGNQKVVIRGKAVQLHSKEDGNVKQYQILFDETFYTDQDVAYQIICLNGSLTSGLSEDGVKTDSSRVFSLNSVDECSNFLWKYVAKSKIKSKIDDLIILIKSEIQTMDPVNMDACFAHMHGIYIASYNIITAQKTYTKLSSTNENIQNSLKLALEMYLCQQLSSTIFWALTDVTASKDEEVNVASRRYQYIWASKSGIRFDVCENIPRAKKELNAIRGCTTPVGICECIRRVVAELSCQKSSFGVLSVSNGDASQDSRSSLLVTSDDLLSALIFLIIKSDIPNWFAYLEFGSKFRFSNCSRDDEYQYYLTTLEAALEHIRGMATASGNGIEYEDDVMDTISMRQEPKNADFSSWNKQLDSSISLSRVGPAAYQMNQIRYLFQLIESGQTSAVREQLERSIRRGPIDQQVQPHSPIGQWAHSGRSTVGPANFELSRGVAGQHSCHPLCDCSVNNRMRPLPGRSSISQSAIEGFLRRTQGRTSEVTTVGGVANDVMQASHTFDVSSTSRHSSVCPNSGEIGVEKSAVPSFKRSVSVNTCDDRGWNALHVASWFGKLDIVSLLLEVGFEPGFANLEGDTALHLAAKRGYQDVLFRLLDNASADILGVRNGAGHSPLHLAVEYGYASCVTTLIYQAALVNDKSTDINCPNSAGNTPLHIAATWGYSAIVKCLLDHEACTLLRNSRGQQPHEVASTRQLLWLIRIRSLQQQKTRITTPAASSISSSSSARTPSLLSATKNVSMTTSFCSSNNGWDKKLPSKKMKKKAQSLEKWSTKKTGEKFKDVIPFSISLSPDDMNHKIQKLLKVVADGDLQMLMFMLEISDIDGTDTSPVDVNRSLCHPLCQCSKCRPVQSLIIKNNCHQLNVNSNNREGFQCLHIAAIHDRSTIAKFLITHGAVLSTCLTTKAELHPLHFTAIYGSIKVLSILLLQKNVNVNILDKKLNSALCYACAKGNYEAAELLIQAGADINIQNHNGNTPLHEAVRNNHEALVQLLVDNGAQLHVRNSRGFIPLDLAKDLNLYVRIKKLFVLETKPHTNDEVDSNLLTLNNSWTKETNIEDNESISGCSVASELSSVSEADNGAILLSTEPLFAQEEDSVQQRRLLNKSDSVIEVPLTLENLELDASLLERIDSNNTKYNYRLTFKDPNSPSISSTASSIDPPLSA